MNVTFLGAGAFGTALGEIAEENGNTVSFYDPIKYPEKSLKEAVNNAEVIVYTAPSDQYQKLLKDLPKDIPLICASKGFLSLEPFKDFEDFSALGGAAFAEDFEAIKDGEDTHGRVFLQLTASSPISETLFTTDYLHIQYTEDVKGILLCGALKNVYAIGAGLYGDESADDDIMAFQGFLSEVIHEFISVLDANGSSKDILLLSCGAEDLMLSCTPDSRNFRFGRALKNHDKKEKDATIEGLAVVKSIEKTADFIIPEDATILKDIIKTVTEEA